MLPRYVALFRVSLDEHFVDFICMTNAFGGVETVDTRFDLKVKPTSSWRRQRRRRKTPATRTAIGFPKAASSHQEQAAIRMMEALAVDSAFLARRGLIDYSLLVGVHATRASPSPAAAALHPDHIRVERTPNSLCSIIWEEDGSFTRMYIPMVDILTPYGLKKYAELLPLHIEMRRQLVSLPTAAKVRAALYGVYKGTSDVTWRQTCIIETQRLYALRGGSYNS